MAETTDIRTANSHATVTAEISMALDPGPPPGTVPLIGIYHVYDNPNDMERPEENGMVDFWLAPEEATKLAYRLLTLAYQARTEIAE